ncbi:hypothetical protein Tco_1330614 [Tanacetum coccineum]
MDPRHIDAKASLDASDDIARHRHQIDHDGVALCLRRRLHALRTILLGESSFKSVISSVSSLNEPKSRVFPPNAIQVLKP